MTATRICTMLADCGVEGPSLRVRIAESWLADRDAAVAQERARGCTDPAHEAAVRLADQVVSSLDSDLADRSQGWQPIYNHSHFVQDYRAARAAKGAK